MIDKGMLYRENFRGGDAAKSDAASGRSAGRADPSGGVDRGGGDGGNRFTSVTKDVLNPNVDYVGPTAFGPTQKYSGDGFFSGCRNLDSKGQPLMGLAYLGDRIKSFASKINPLSLIGGLVAGPIGSFVGRGISSLGALRNYDTLSDYAKGELGLFQNDEDQNQTIDIRDIYNRSNGITNTRTIGEIIAEAAAQNNIPINNSNTLRTGPFNNRLSNLRMLPMQRDLVKTGRLQEFQNVPSANPQDYDFLSNAMAEVTQKDINASKAKGFNKMNYNTAIDLGMISPNVTEYEFEQLKQGNITSPGSYQA